MFPFNRAPFIAYDHTYRIRINANEIPAVNILRIKMLTTMHSSGLTISQHVLGREGVSGWGVYQRGVCPGWLARGVYPSMQWGRHPLWTDRHL